MAKIILLIGIEALLFVFIAGAILGQTPPKEKPAEKPVAQEPAKAEAEPATKEPTAEWLKQYDELLALSRVIDQMKAEHGIDKLEDELKKKGNVLGSQFPPGYTFDPPTRKFTKIVGPPAPEPTKK